MRNPNGLGGVSKQSGSRRNPWIARIVTGWNEKGNPIRKTIGHFEKREDALDALLKYKQGGVSPKAGITLKDLYDEWSEGHYRHVSKSTVQGYEAAWKHVDSLGPQKFSNLRAAHWQNIIDGLDMSRSSLHKIKTLAVMLNSYAVQHDITQKNYASFIKLPKWVKQEKEAFTDVEIKKLFDSVEKEKWSDTILIMIHTGMRINELLSLTKFQVDLTNNVIKTGSKTDAGNRVIPIHSKIKPLIASRYEEAEDYLFSNQRKRIDPNNYRRHLYYPTLERLKIRRLTPHSCRHTFASLLARAKVQTVNIQKLLGHTDYSLTANVYTHPDVLELQTAINQI